jgi:RNA polymerase-binding transcription factor DksA
MNREEGLTVQDLEIQRLGLEDRIRRLERDLKAPLDQDFNEQAGQLNQRMILSRLLEIERSNLQKVNQEILKKTSN